MHVENGDGLVLDPARVHSVLSVQELDDLSTGVAHGAIVVHHQILHGLDQTTLDVSRLTGLHGGIDDTFATSHGVEEELLRCQALQVRVDDEAVGVGA